MPWKVNSSPWDEPSASCWIGDRNSAIGGQGSAQRKGGNSQWRALFSLSAPPSSLPLLQSAIPLAPDRKKLTVDCFPGVTQKNEVRADEGSRDES